MKNLFCCFLEQIQLIFNYQHWYRWVVGAIIIFAFDYQILMGIKVFQPVKDLIPLFKIRNRRHCRCKEKSFRLFSEGLKPGSMPECWFYLWLQVNDLLREDNQN